MTATENPIETSVCLSSIDDIYLDEPEMREAWVFSLSTGISVEDVKKLYLPPEGPEPENVLRKHYIDYEWGASASVTEYFVQMAQDIPKDLVLAGLGYIASKLGAKAKQILSEQDDSLFDRERANSTAIHALVMAYKTASAESLKIIGESHSMNPLRYQFEYNDGEFRYEASVEKTASGITVTRISRREPR